MKPHVISIAIERIVDAGPVTLGLSDIKVVRAGANGSTVHAASVVVTAMMVGGPANARAFQNDVCNLFRQAQKETAVLDADGNEVAPLPQAESPASPGQEPTT